jgi:hypothetical protein
LCQRFFFSGKERASSVALCGDGGYAVVGTSEFAENENVLLLKSVPDVHREASEVVLCEECEFVVTSAVFDLRTMTLSARGILRPGLQRFGEKAEVGVYVGGTEYLSCSSMRRVQTNRKRSRIEIWETRVSEAPERRARRSSPRVTDRLIVDLKRGTFSLSLFFPNGAPDGDLEIALRLSGALAVVDVSRASTVVRMDIEGAIIFEPSSGVVGLQDQIDPCPPGFPTMVR